MRLQVVAVLGVHGDAVRAFYHVVVGQDVAVSGDEEARAGGVDRLGFGRRLGQAKAERRGLVAVLVVVALALALALWAEAEHERRALPLTGIGRGGGAGLADDVDGDHGGGYALHDVGEGHGRTRRGRGGCGDASVDGPAFGAGASEIAAGPGEHEGSEGGAGEELAVLGVDHGATSRTGPPQLAGRGRAMVTWR